MIHSMTAFARTEVVTEAITVSMMVRSLNSRHLDINIRLPTRFMILEERIRGSVTRCLTRGRIDIRVQIQEKGPQSLSFMVDDARAEAYHAALESIRQKFGINTPVSLRELVENGGIIKPVETAPDSKACLPVVDECLETALADLVAMRKTEGAFIEGDFNTRLAFIEEKRTCH